VSILVVLVATIVIPNFVRARTTKSKQACVNHLRQVDGAKEQRQVLVLWNSVGAAFRRKRNPQDFGREL